MYLDSTYILILIGAALSLGASAYVNYVYKKYSKVQNSFRISGAEMAAKVLQENGLRDVEVRPVSGTLTDHYDPASETVNLSDPVYKSRSISAIAVAAHECGYAIQEYSGMDPTAIQLPRGNARTSK